MKYAKMLALAAVAVGALMAFLGASTASASVICSTTVTTCPEAQIWPNGTVIDFSLASGAKAKLVSTSNEVLDECTTSTVQGEITNSANATGKITSLTWGGCTFTTTTTQNGGLQVDKIAGTSNGTVTADGPTNVTINTVLFGSCIYTVPSGSIGDIKEGIGSAATFTANATAEKVTGSNFACPTTSKWTAEYVLTTPSNTTLSVS